MSELTTVKTNSSRATTLLRVSGMTCGNCARHVTESLQGVPGVQSATVNLEAQRASVRWNPGASAIPAALIEAVEKEGYGAKITDASDANKDQINHKLAGWQIALWIGVCGTLPIMTGEWVFKLGGASWFQWTSFLLAALVQVFAGAPFYRGAWSQIKVGSSNMDTLVALGSTTAFSYSVWALFSGFGGHVYFMESASIITLISIGHWMESRVSVRASGALQQLLNLAPQTARKIVRDSRFDQSQQLPGNRNSAGFIASLKINQTGNGSKGNNPGQTVVKPPAISSPFDLRGFKPAAGVSDNEIEVPIADLIAGDSVALRPGDQVPTDGKVVEGNSAVDEAMLTGESIPMDKTVGSLLYAGTLNLDGRLTMRVTATGEETALANIIAAVQRAQASRANIQRLGDRVSNVFVPIVVSLAVLAGLCWGLAPDSTHQVHDWLARFLWHALPPFGAAAPFIIAAAVLIVACPCAMGLATPVAIMAGSNTAARRGILIRDGVALEKAGEVTVVVFDKTGTLTIGRPVVEKSWEANNVQDICAAKLAAALARNSTHPISQAIAKLSPGEFKFSEWEEVRGSGIRARITPATGEPTQPQRAAWLGSLKWLRESGVNMAGGEPFVQEWSDLGATIVGVAIENALVGLFAVKDTLKPGAPEVVQSLKRQGMKVFMVTGDNALTAKSIARQCGIELEHVFAEVRSEQKAAFVGELQQKGERVAFVGDGINDAPALEQANLGIAVSRASDVAREAADIILLKSEIEAIPESLGLARATLRTIKQNLFWAFFYNALGVPLAALGFMSPILCAAAMGFSDLIVIGNALRLRNWKLRHRS